MKARTEASPAVVLAADAAASGGRSMQELDALAVRLIYWRVLLG
jgi:hypothetical protein